MIYVITKSVNDYNQHGEYFVAAFTSKPSIDSIKSAVGCSDDIANHILNGAGSVEYDNAWFYLYALNPGQTI